MRSIVILTAVAVAALVQSAEKTRPKDGAVWARQSAVERLGWQIGIQTYSFNRFTLFEAIEKAKAAGVKFIEAYPGQKIAKDMEGAMGPAMGSHAMEKVKAKLKECDITLVAFGVTGLGSEEEARKTFEFAKTMGIKVVTSEPDPKNMAMIDKLCAEYDLKVGIHNHPKPSRYWNPDTVLEAVKGCSDRIGACADTGHWARSELDPVECMKKLSGRIVSMHMKDLNQKGGGAHDVVWGTGVCNIPAIMEEMLKQNFKGPISIEYEHNWDNSLPEITKCVEFFTQKARELLRTQRGQRGDWDKTGGEKGKTGGERGKIGGEKGKTGRDRRPQ